MILRLLFSIFPLLLCVLAAPSRSDERFRPLSPEQLPVDTTEDRVFFVPGTQVSYVNYELIRRDFKQTGHMSNQEIDSWVISNFAYISEGQLQLRGLWTTPFDVDMSRVKTGYRPPNYRRSAMLQADEGGLVDIKGIGYPLGSQTDEVLRKTEALRKSLFEARAEVQNATSENLPEAQKKLARAESLLTHIDGSMRSGEALAETYKQESLQNVANRLNRESVEHGWGLPRVETVETYFVLHLPWRVKDASGEREESVSLYGRQATAGHGRGSPVSPDIAYNPVPHVGANPSEEFRGSNALQISNSGAIFDYGSIAVTEPEARALHGYHHFTQDAVDRGAYFDLFDSNINNHAYALARDMDEKHDSWEAKREWLLQQRRVFVPNNGAEPAPPDGKYGELVNLYQAVVNREFDSIQAKKLMKKIVSISSKNLGGDWLRDTVAMRNRRIEHLTLVTILAAMDAESAKAFVEVAKGAGTPAPSRVPVVTEFLERTQEVVTTHTEGMGDVPVPPTITLWDALEKSGDRKARKFAISEELHHLSMSLRVGPGNAALRALFIEHLQSSDLKTRQRMLDFLSQAQSHRLDSSAAEKLLKLPEVQDALASAFMSNAETKDALKYVADQMKAQNAQALALMRDSESRPTPRTEAIMAANPLRKKGNAAVDCIRNGLAGLFGR